MSEENIENVWREPFNSPVFGHCEGLSDRQLSELIGWINANPVAAFGILNGKLNGLGMCISIDALPKIEEENDE